MERSHIPPNGKAGGSHQTPTAQLDGDMLRDRFQEATFSQQEFRSVPKMEGFLNLIRPSWGWVANPYISRIHTAYIGEDSSILGTWNVWWFSLKHLSSTLVGWSQHLHPYQGIGKDVPRSQRITPSWEIPLLISPITRGYLWVVSSPRIPMGITYVNGVHPSLSLDLTGVVLTSTKWSLSNLVSEHLWDWDGHFFQQRPATIPKRKGRCCVD